MVCVTLVISVPRAKNDALIFVTVTSFFFFFLSFSVVSAILSLVLLFDGSKANHPAIFEVTSLAMCFNFPLPGAETVVSIFIAREDD